MNILVTGGTGYLASSVANYLSMNDQHVTLATRNKSILSKNKNIKFQYIDWNSMSSINDNLVDIDVVIHAAGMNSHECNKNPEDAFNCNGLNTQKIARISKDHEVKKFFYFSTAHVYRNPLIGEISEETLTNNNHPYATSHRQGEEFAKEELKNSNTKLYNLRISNIFGKPSNSNTNCWDLIVNLICSEAIRHGRVTIQNDGSQLRDFLSINEFNQIIYFLLNFKETQTQTETLNIGSGYSHSIKDICETVKKIYFEIFNKEVVVSYNKIQKSDMHEKIFKYEVSKLLRKGYKFRYNINDQIQELLLFCKSEILK